VIHAQPIRTQRLTLEPLRIDHANEMVDVLADPALYEFIGGEPPTEADLVARYSRQVSRDDWLNWIVRLAENETVVGTVQATVRNDATELAWVLAREAQGHGYATEATQAVIDQLDDDLLIAHIHPDHAASSAVAKRLGFQPTDQLKDGEVRWELRPRCQN
jgi:RimJ/RimL family protein N-acetyltransferase